MSPRATIVTDLGYGDAGKGSVVDYLAGQSESSAVVRFNGGPQAAHNVLTPDGRHHTFAQFGSGTFIPGVPTYLSRFMLVNPFNLYAEEKHLRDIGVSHTWSRLRVDAEAMVITPWQQTANRLREISRGSGRHGSCGQGVGETMSDLLTRSDLVVRVGDFFQPRALRAKLEGIREHKRNQLRPLVEALPDTEDVWDELRVLEDPWIPDECIVVYLDFLQRVSVVERDYLKTLLETYEHVIFEGAQGVLLDEWFGFSPYNTWSTTTFENALTLLDEQDYSGDITRLGLIRGYSTRHGPGPFATEDSQLTLELPDAYNGHNEWQREFRVGFPDLVMLRYARTVTGSIDEVGVTCLDRLNGYPDWYVAASYQAPYIASDITNYVTTNPDGSIHDLHPDGKDNLEHQEKLTRLLFTCQPRYQKLNAFSGFGDAASPAYIDELLGRIAEESDAPVTLTSFGPTRTDKRSLATC